MAQKKKKSQKKIRIEECSLKMQEHFQQLGISSVEVYKEWCRAYNFSQGLDKTPRQRQDELYVMTRTQATKMMAKKKKDSNLREILPKIYNQELRSEKLQNSVTRAISETFESSIAPKVLLKLLLYLEDNSDLLKETSYIQGIAALANHHESWIRPVETWKVKKHNRDRQFSELARHLLAAYEIPLFMDCVWFNGNVIHQNWFKHIGTGQNIRTASDIPIPFTKKMAHHFLKAPRRYTIEEALRWGQVHALGGDKYLADAFRGTRLTGTFNNDDFWLNVIRFFIANPMLDVSHVHPIIDYIWHQRYENRRVFVERGVAREIGPAQPNFSMRRRTPETLLRQVEEWHGELGRESKDRELEWHGSEIGEFHLLEGSEEARNMKFWSIRELLSSDELIDESRILRHCVSTYARSCHTGRSSIWSMEIEDENGRRKILTIEVAPREKVIRQVRGRRNRLATPKEKNLLGKWAEQEDLQLAGYI
ncbi:hypothetical protein F4009_19780 [Candidatus Poribacteria bacterium]|nr:hypothetical protein [Candidatus Poribacteria bacterium]MYH81652.1 hypothetical protein [Candidatus Poribacteria bacterium]MYK96207.1 hypothetical protein [Candidatus Poribacteria bacterium]